MSAHRKGEFRSKQIIQDPKMRECRRSSQKLRVPLKSFCDLRLIPTRKSSLRPPPPCKLGAPTEGTLKIRFCFKTYHSDRQNANEQMFLSSPFQRSFTPYDHNHVQTRTNACRWTNEVHEDLLCARTQTSTQCEHARLVFHSVHEQIMADACFKCICGKHTL